jgi:hypothetical protein
MTTTVDLIANELRAIQEFNERLADQVNKLSIPEQVEVYHALGLACLRVAAIIKKAAGIQTDQEVDPMTKPDYCTQNDGDCPTCSLVNYGRDCMNNRLHTLGSLAQAITGGNITSMAKILNDSGMTPRINELEPDPGEFIPRPAIVDLFAMRAGDIVGRRAAELLQS